MKKFLTLAAILALGLTATAQNSWIHSYGGTAWDYGNSAQQTTDGGYILAGYTDSYGAGGSDVYLVKVDPDGNQQWFNTFGGSHDEEGFNVQQTTDGGYIITGWTYPSGPGNSEVYLIKTDTFGNQQWTHTYGSSTNDNGYCVQQTADGGYIIVGSEFGYFSDICLIKTDAVGNQQWIRNYGGGNIDEGFGVQQTTDGGFIIVGAGYSYGAGDRDVYLIKTDASGHQQWFHTFGGSGTEYGYSVQQANDGGYIVVGYTDSYGSGANDVYLIKTDSLGNAQWSHTFGGSGGDGGASVQQTYDGGYIIAGYTYSSGAGSSDVYLIKTDAIGNQQWFRTYGENSYDWGQSVQQTSDGGYIIGGEIRSNNNYNACLIKTDAMGNVGNVLDVTIVPFTSPVVIPPSGGSFNFYLFAQNSGPVMQTADLWTKVIYPNGVVKSPVSGPYSAALDTGTTAWYRHQNVPGFAPAGTYSYIAIAGDYPDNAWVSDTLEFVKLAAGSGIMVGDWNCSEKPSTVMTAQPGEFKLSSASPNPFNPTTNLTFTLPQAAKVSLVVFDISGRVVGAQHASPLPAGEHSLTFDGSNLPSGIYFARLTAGEYTAVQKMVLLK